MIIRLSHPWSYHKTRDILTAPDDLSEGQARALVSGGAARRLEDIVTDLGGGWYEVPLRNGKTKKVRSLDAAVKILKRQAGQ